MMNNGIIHLLLLLLLWLHLSSLCLFSNLLLLLPILPILRRTLLKIHPKTRRKNDHSARVIACVDSVFHDLELQLNDLLPQFDLQLFHFDLARHKLEKIKAFVVVSGTQLDHMDVAKLASFWLRIETTVSKYGNQIRPLLRYSYFNRNLPDSHKNIIFEFLAEISSLEGETAEWYVTMADSLYLRQQSVVISCSSLVTTDEVLTIMSFSFEILDSLRQSELTVQGEALVEQMTFLQSLIRFVGDDTQDLLIQEFLVHVKVLAVQIHVLFMCPEALDGELEEESLSDDDDDDDERPNDIVLTLLQKIKPTDNFVYQAYTQALISSKLSRQSLAPNDLDMDPDAFKATKNFLDSIISYLWEILLGNCVHPFSIKDQLQELYGGLKTLRTTIKQQQLPNKLANNIGIVLCDAGALVFSLYQRHRGPDLGLLQELLKTIKATLVQLGVKDPQSPVFYFQKTNQLDFVDSVLEQLTELTGRGDKQPRNRSHCLLVLNDKLVSFRSFLGDIVELRHQYVEFQTLWDRVLEVAYRVEGLVGQLLVDDHQDSFSSSLVSTMKDIQGIQAEIEVKRSEIKVKRQELTEVTETCNLLPSSQKPLLPTTNEFVGFMDDARSVLDRLTRGSAHLQIIAIVGMPGMGKTTLATKIYNDYYVSCFFSVRAWSQISQTVDRKKILGNLINQVDPNNKYPELGEQDLVQILWRKLKGKRYLILLDDIWDNEAWKILAASFPDDNAKSRILLTSRHSDVAPREMMVDQKPYALRPLNEEESIELLQKKLFKENVGWHPTFRAFGSKIAERCRGVPLMIIIVAGILENTAPEGWKGVLDDLNSGNLSITDHCRRTLDLSYECLPDDLRQCFLYFRAFPEDEEIPAKRLFYLWTAEGFFRRDKDERMEDIAEEYLNSLIGRNLIVVAKRRWDGGVKACRIHDLLREFCLHKASEEHFLHVLKGYDDLLAFNEPYGLQRLSIHSEVHHLKESKLFCPRVRSLLFHSSEKKRREISLRIHSFKHLRVLDLEQCPLKVSFSRELELLVQLTFLAIHCEFGNRSVSSICKLSNLETLIVNTADKQFSLPHSVWNLQKLKYLCIRNFSCTLPIENLDASSVLYDLDRLCGVVIPYWGSMEKLFRKFPNVRRLKCMVFEHQDNLENLDKIVFPEFLSQLKSLHVFGRCPSYLPITVDLNFPAHLKNLSLSVFHLSSKNMSAIGELPNLQVLKLSRISFDGNTWEMREGEFCKLRILKLCYLESLVIWRACDDQMVCLQELMLDRCKKLEEMPCFLESIATLETISVFYSSDASIKFVRKIEQEQEQWGNQLKVIIRN